MAKYLIEYDPNTCQFTDDSGLVIATYCGANLKTAEESEAPSDVLALVKQGLSADDLVKLKNMGII
jgi:hypothetical protein